MMEERRRPLVFYSWQTDLDPRANRNFFERALKVARQAWQRQVWLRSARPWAPSPTSAWTAPSATL
jgi:hypothetical protein